MAALGVLGMVGCGGDLTGADFGSAGQDTDAADGDGATAEPNAGTTGAEDSTGGQPPAEPDGDSGEGTEEGDTCDIDCGPGGFCDFDIDGSPMCTCGEGYVAFGLRCLECQTTPGPVAIDIPVVQVTASFTFNGGDFPNSIYEYGEIVLYDPVSGDEVELGQTREGGTTEPVAVLPGTYEVRYRNRKGGSTVPANQDAVIETVKIPEGEASWSLDLAVESVHLDGDLQLGGATPPNSIYENGWVVLRNPTTGDEVVLGETRGKTFEVVVLPGLYDIHYRSIQAESVAPVNADVRIGELFVDDFELTQEATIDVEVTMLSGDFLLDGAAPPDSVYENGEIRLRDVYTLDEVVLGQTRDGSYAVPVAPGTYEVVYHRVAGGDVVPTNSAAVLQDLVLSAGDQPFDVGIQTAVVSGTITIDGAPPPTDPNNDAVLLLRDPDTGDEATLGHTNAGAYSRRVVAGEYDVHYRQETSSGLIPVNSNALLQQISVLGGANFNIEIPVVTFGAEVTLNGMLPPDSAYDDGMLYLRNHDTGDSVLLGSTRLASLQRPVVPGTYDMVYVVEAAGPTVPVNADAGLGQVDVSTTPQIELDIPVSSMGGPITVAGAAPPTGVYNQAQLLLHDVATQDIIYLGGIAGGAFGQSLTAGTYVLAYQGLTSTGLLPRNRNAGLACYTLTSP